MNEYDKKDKADLNRAGDNNTANIDADIKNREVTQGRWKKEIRQVEKVKEILKLK